MIEALILASATIVVALVGAVSASRLKKLDRNNTSQHGVSMDILHEVRAEVFSIRDEVLDLRETIAEVREDQVAHLQWHIEADPTVVVLSTKRRAG